MKPSSQFCILLTIAFVLIGCYPAVDTAGPNQTEQPTIPTDNLPTITLVSPSTSTLTQTPRVLVEPHPSPTLITTERSIPVNTLEPEQAKETIKKLLSEPIDCAAPCFWGIVPGQTTAEEARVIFRHLNLQVANNTYDGNGFTGVDIDFDSGLSMIVILKIQNDSAENVHVKINPEKQKVGIAREWLTYSPDTLIKRYGAPSRVDFVADWGPGPFFAMQMYFDSVDLMVQYAGDEIIPSQKGLSQVCPQTVQFDSVWLWMGKNPTNPPGKGVPLEKAASMTVDQFSKLITGDPNHACFSFNGNAFQ